MKGKGRSSTQLECDQVYQGIKRWKAHEGAVLLPVVRKSTIASLRERAKPRWWRVKKGMLLFPCLAILSTQSQTNVHHIVSQGRNVLHDSRNPSAGNRQHRE